MIKLIDITLLEADLIDNKRGSRSPLFSKMMNDTFELLSDKTLKANIEQSESIEIQNKVLEICLLINTGIGIKESVRRIAGNRSCFYDKLNTDQRILIKNTKSKYTSSKAII